MSAPERYAVSSRVAVHTIWGNLGLFVVKAWMGVASGSTALMADALHTLSDIASTIVVLFGIKMAAAPPDKNHPYGHGRAESIAAKILALFLIAVGLGMAYTAFARIRQTDFEIPTSAALWAALVSIGGKEAMFWYAVSTGRRYNNKALMADAWHHRSDALSSVAALIGIALARAGYPLLDPLSGLAVAALVVFTGGGILRDSINELMDSQTDQGLIQQLKKLAVQVRGCERVDSLHIRRYGSTVVVDLRISVSGQLTVTEGHDVAHAVRNLLINQVDEVSDVLVHVNPLERSRRERPGQSAIRNTGQLPGQTR